MALSLVGLVNTSVITNTTNNYKVKYDLTIDESFLTNSSEFTLENYDIMAYNTLILNFGSIQYERGSIQNFEYYYTYSFSIVDENEVLLYDDGNTFYNDSSSSISWTTLNIGGAVYLDSSQIDNYLGSTLSFEFYFYCSNADTFVKNSNTNRFAYITHTDSGVYRNGYRIGYEDGKIVGYDDGVADSNSLYQMVVAVPDRFIQSFKVIFNFEVFGVNVFNFIVSIISIGLIIWLVKKVSGS